MHISWLGNSAFKVETKTPLRDEVVILLNPYQAPKAELPRNLKSDIVLLTEGLDNTITLSGEPFVIDTPGEYEIKGVMIYAVAVPSAEGDKKQHLIFHFETELLSTTFLGDFNGKLSDELTNKLGVIDILLLPAGGHGLLEPKDAADLINQLEPRLAVPHSFNPPGGKDQFEEIDKLAKILGHKEHELLPKLKIAKKELPQDETKLILLEKSR